MWTTTNGRTPEHWYTISSPGEPSILPIEDNGKFIFIPCNKSYIQNLVENGLVVSEKSKFSFSYVRVNDIGPRSRNGLDLEYSHILMNSISCLHLPTFRSQTAICSENSTVLTFFIAKPNLQIFTLSEIGQGQPRAGRRSMGKLKTIAESIHGVIRQQFERPDGRTHG